MSKIQIISLLSVISALSMDAENLKMIKPHNQSKVVIHSKVQELLKPLLIKTIIDRKSKEDLTPQELKRIELLNQLSLNDTIRSKIQNMDITDNVLERSIGNINQLKILHDSSLGLSLKRRSEEKILGRILREMQRTHENSTERQIVEILWIGQSDNLNELHHQHQAILDVSKKKIMNIQSIMNDIDDAVYVARGSTGRNDLTDGSDLEGMWVVADNCAAEKVESLKIKLSEMSGILPVEEHDLKEMPITTLSQLHKLLNSQDIEGENQINWINGKTQVQRGDIKNSEMVLSCVGSHKIWGKAENLKKKIKHILQNPSVALQKRQHESTLQEITRHYENLKKNEVQPIMRVIQQISLALYERDMLKNGADTKNRSKNVLKMLAASIQAESLVKIREHLEALYVIWMKVQIIRDNKSLNKKMGIKNSDAQNKEQKREIKKMVKILKKIIPEIL